MGLRCAINATRIRDCLVSYCKGNPFILDTPLKNIASGVLIPDKAAADILSYPELGQARYDELVENRL